MAMDNVLRLILVRIEFSMLIMCIPFCSFSYLIIYPITSLLKAITCGMFISILLWPKPFSNKMVTLRIKHFSYHINKVLRVSPKVKSKRNDYTYYRVVHKLIHIVQKSTVTS